MRSTAVAYLLWFFFGLLGVHRFYCGRIGTGVLWFFTGGLFLIGWVVDVFLIPGMVRDANAEYLAYHSYGTMNPPPAPYPAAAGRTPDAAASIPRGQRVEGVSPGYRVVFCTRCGAPMQVPVHAAGQAFACPSCRSVLEIPAVT